MNISSSVAAPLTAAATASAAFAQAMTDTLQASRGQSLINKGAEKTRDDFKDADKAMGGLNDAMGAMQSQMDDLNPVNGLRLSTAA